MTYQFTNPIPNPFSPVADSLRDFGEKILPSSQELDKLKQFGSKLAGYAVPTKNHIAVVDGDWGYEPKSVTDSIAPAARKILDKLNSEYAQKFEEFGKKLIDTGKSTIGYKDMFNPTAAYKKIEQEHANRIAADFKSRGIYLNDKPLLQGLNTIREWAKKTGDNIANFKDIPMQDIYGSIPDIVYGAYA
ncbi:MAG: hypothetical protein GOU99_01865 [Candidatus Altiarchaeota archaeon]|nr:hypothetical protein [Candidatus Altiarchaeota archaeon]